jgi:hypothetical protein
MLNDVNKTELLQICSSAGISVHPASSKEEIKDAIVTRGENVKPNPIDEWRNALMDFLLDYWVQVRSQITCPATDLVMHVIEDPLKPHLVKRKPGLPQGRVACRKCPDMRVMACVAINSQFEEQIAKKVKNG